MMTKSSQNIIKNELKYRNILIKSVAVQQIADRGYVKAMGFYAFPRITEGMLTSNPLRIGNKLTLKPKFCFVFTCHSFSSIINLQSLPPFLFSNNLLYMNRNKTIVNSKTTCSRNLPSFRKGTKLKYSQLDLFGTLYIYIYINNKELEFHMVIYNKNLY